jgi:hypothetical protein
MNTIMSMSRNFAAVPLVSPIGGRNGVDAIDAAVARHPVAAVVQQLNAAGVVPVVDDVLEDVAVCGRDVREHIAAHGGCRIESGVHCSTA